MKKARNKMKPLLKLKWKMQLVSKCNFFWSTLFKNNET